MSATWPKDELRPIAETDDLHISPFREDRKTYGTRHGFGPSRSMAGCMCGHITVRATLVPGGDQAESRPDHCGGHNQGSDSSPYLKPMISPGASAATVKVKPRAESNSKGN